MFSLINFVAVSAEKSSSLHIIISKTRHKQSNTLSSSIIEYIFILIEIRYFILLAINTHIDCANNCTCSVRCIFKATARSLESVTLSIFCNKGPIHHVDKNGGHFYGENFLYEYPIKGISSQTNKWISFIYSATV